MVENVMRDIVTDAIGHWERRRILYNLALLAVVVATYMLDAGTAPRPLSFELLQQLFVFAVLANVAFCAAYPADLFAQVSAFRATWRRVRWVLLIVGVLFASVLAHFISRGIFGGAG
jgi:hypothetical protein